MATLHKSQKGFSLIEILIALSILTAALIVVSTAWSTTMIRMRKMKMNHQAAFLLDYKVSDMERQFKDQLTQLPDEKDGTFEELGSEFKNYTWSMKSKKFELPDLTPLFAKQKNQQGTDVLLSSMMGQLSDYFNQAAKEVTVTVVYTYNKKNVKFAATTFLVDFNQVLPMPNLGGGGTGGN